MADRPLTGGLGRYLARRLGALVPLLAFVVVVVFALVHLTPGDPAAVIAGPDATPAQVAALRHTLGLDAPLGLQFLRWLGAVCRGDLGRSLYFGEPVARTLVAHAAPTVSLTAVALSLALAVAVPAGIGAALVAGSLFDRAVVTLAVVAVSVPSFWLGLIGIITLAAQARLVPVAGYVPLSDGVWPWLHALLLPGAVLAAGQVGIIARLLRDAMLEVLPSAYVRTARAKGLARTRIVLRHALPNAALPAITALGTIVAALLGGAVVTETVFALPGIGELVVDSLARRDYPVVQGAVLLAAVVYALVSIVVDTSYALLDPRVRYG